MVKENLITKVILHKHKYSFSLSQLTFYYPDESHPHFYKIKSSIFNLV